MQAWWAEETSFKNIKTKILPTPNIWTVVCFRVKQNILWEIFGWIVEIIGLIYCFNIVY